MAGASLASARVVVDTLVDAKVVATPAIRRGPNGTFVYVVGEDSRVAVRPVDVAEQDETLSVIGKGVEIGERIVTVGFAQLADGKEVQISGEAPPANPPEAGNRKGGRKPDGSGAEHRRRRDQTGSSDNQGQRDLNRAKEVAR